MATVLEKLLRVGEGRILKKLERQAKLVANLEGTFAELSDVAVRASTRVCRARL